MDKVKVFYLVNDNGEIFDTIIGDEYSRQTALITKDYLEKTNESWLKYRIVELEGEGTIHKGHTNILTTIKLNGMPHRSIINNFYNVVEIIEKYMDLEDDYRKYTYFTEYINYNINQNKRY